MQRDETNEMKVESEKLAAAARVCLSSFDDEMQFAFHCACWQSFTRGAPE